jgi:hypothetical protein
MGPDRLRSFSSHRTWRWRLDPGDPDHYLAVESTDQGLRYFAWSHLHGEDGLTREARQPFDAFERDGPLWEMPEDVERGVREWLATHRP